MNLILRFRKEILAVLGILFLYFITRLILLGNFPIFTDEAIYVRWAQIASNDAAWRFISLTDGKQPMLIWFGMIFVKFIQDPLTAVRLVSVVSGLFSLVGIFFLTYELFKNRFVGLLSSLLYVFYPFAVVYDRMALYDSMVSAFAIWAIYFSIILVRKTRLDVAYTLGFVLGGGLLTKSSAIFSLYLLPLTLLLFEFRKKTLKKDITRWTILAIFSILVGEIIYNILRLSPFFHIVTEKNAIFVYPFSEWIKHPFNFFLGNLEGLCNWLLTYLTPFYAFLILFSFASIKFIKEKILLVLFFVLPFVALALFGKVIFPRFIFFMSLYLIPLASLGLFNLINLTNEFMKKRKLNLPYVFSSLIIVFFIMYPAKVAFDFIFDPSNSSIADADKRQYITEWPAGGGVRESVKFFEEQAKNQKIFVGTQGTFGLMPASLDIFLGKNPNIKTIGYWPIKDEIPADVLEYAKQMPTYFVFYQPCPSCKFSGDAPDPWPLKLVSQFKKSEGVYYSVYKVE